MASTHLIMTKLLHDYGLRIRDHEWLRRALKRTSGWDASTCAFMLANDWQRGRG
jgi:hypothetical protein